MIHLINIFYFNINVSSNCQTIPNWNLLETISGALSKYVEEQPIISLKNIPFFSNQELQLNNTT